MQIGCTLLSPQDLDAAKETGFDYAEFMGKYLVSLSSSEYLELQRAVKGAVSRWRGSMVIVRKP